MADHADRNMPASDRRAQDLELGITDGYDPRTDGKAVNGSGEAQELKIFGLRLGGLPGWAKYLILASMVFFLSLSAAYCAELVFIQAEKFDICA
jgi:hypothetical protein